MDAITTEALTSTEMYELRGHEQTIERGLGTFQEVGAALLAIREKKLYRTYGTFDAYCQGRWGIKHSQSNRLMDAAQVMNNLSPIGGSLPVNERQARELAKLDNADQVLAWKVVAETAEKTGGKVTAGFVKAIADTLGEMRDTGHLTFGEAAALPTSEIFQARLTTEARELMLREQEYIAEGRKKRAHVANNSGEFEWYTPLPIIEAARRTMGRIDCDPASSVTANKKVCAEIIYTLDNSGLDFKNKWAGKVWLNPPYAYPIVEEFSQKLISQLRSGIMEQACVLVNNATDTEWFQLLLGVASAMCLIKGRVKFENAFGEAVGSPLQGQAVIYIGEARIGFKKHFEGLGKVVYVA